MRTSAPFVLLATLSLSVLTLGACASGPPDGPAGAGGPPRGRDFAGGPPPGGDGLAGGPATLFISPSGEPFRARPGEAYPVAAWFAQADGNHDGRLEREEFVADSVRFFGQLDRNQDGLIDSDELRYYEHVVAPEILTGGGPRMGAASDGAIVKAAYLALEQGGMGGMGGGGMGGGPPGGGRGGGGPPGDGGGGARAPQLDGPRMDGAAPYNLLGEPEPVAASDLSFSGRITLADFKRRANQRFDRLDKDKKGYLELASLPKTMAQSMASPDRPRRRRPA